MGKKKINICLDIWGPAGGAEIGYKRIAEKLPQYEWLLTTDVCKDADLVIYSNNHRFYEQAKKTNIPTILRTTGPRSLNMPQPEDLKAVICSSKYAYGIAQHKNKVLIYNGIDFELLKSITPIENDLLYSPARVGVGQQVEVAINYAIKNNRQITVLGAKLHLAEDTYNVLRKKYKFVNWTGLVDNNVALAYMKGCNDYIVPTSVHGVSNAVIEAVAYGKNIINLGKVEVPDIKDIDINNTADKYDELIQSALR